MKIYTGVGDRGETSLFSGERVPKSHARIEAYGDVDELNSVLGALAASLPKAGEALLSEIERIQSELFQVGAWLATTPDSPSLAALEPITQAHSHALESAIDGMQEVLPKLSSFILPGGHVSAAWAQVARAVCRRVERRVVYLAEHSDDSRERLGTLLVYLNRLSDYLFVLARYCNHILGVSEIHCKR